MSADFWAGYVSGAAGIIIGNPLDLIKTRLQAGPKPTVLDTTTNTTTTASNATPAIPPRGFRGHFDNAGTLVRGATAPIITYGALNALLFVTYNRTLALLSPGTASPDSHSQTPLDASSLAKIWIAGATGGLTSFVVSAPTELIKCRAQVSTEAYTTSWSVARDTWRKEGVRGLYYGGGITSIRDAVGYGFYFWSYEWSRRAWSAPEDTERETAVKIMLCGGLAGVITWASIFPLDVVKTRVQTQILSREMGGLGEQHSLLRGEAPPKKRLSSWDIAKHAYRTEGADVFFRGLGICSVRAFMVNAVQWAVYEWMMRLLQPR
ncbi:mitochondrial carrier protein-like protein [Plenodomus tracheiphilus IPT5]|uniref:Mitochondrial carrier protein-like protein n=1 Tax=Plenodomus tracheiphilus IPT5 TaxID=1408161 RepID=A0A6A7BEE5_9PLEO|nr:mitochondrial carrier protein-like protein [Plenodomus tracheiphilus IPT5]